ncbi:MAG: cupin domain-containing protein [Actinomycetota bacterium]|nr:cupin domain-containing protein [Actinomycetota bacterium]
MPVITTDQAAVFELDGVRFTGLASPERGSTESSVWHVRLTSAEPGPPHTLDHEEVLVALSGTAVATLGAEDHHVTPGAAIVVPPGTPFALRCAGSEPFEAVSVLPVGATACYEGGEPFTPPWTA